MACLFVQPRVMFRIRFWPTWTYTWSWWPHDFITDENGFDDKDWLLDLARKWWPVFTIRYWLLQLGAALHRHCSTQNWKHTHSQLFISSLGWGGGDGGWLFVSKYMNTDHGDHAELVHRQWITHHFDTCKLSQPSGWNQMFWRLVALGHVVSWQNLL